MMSFYLLLLVSLCHGLPVQKVAQLSTPNLTKVTALDPPAIEVSWDKVDSGDDKDPVIGYKVKVWEVKKTKTTKYAYSDEKLQQVDAEKEQPIDLISSPEDSGMPVEILTSAVENTATYRNVKLDVTYEIRVLAFTKNDESPMSSPVRIKLEKE